jgi:hypothetical protein
MYTTDSTGKNKFSWKSCLFIGLFYLAMIALLVAGIVITLHTFHII